MSYVKNNKKVYYGAHFVLGQIIEAINPPENIANYVCKDCEVNYCRPHYDVSTGQFLGLYETIGFLVIRGDDDEHFLNHGFCEENSKSLYSCYKSRMPNSFVGTLFNRNHLLCETGQLQEEFANLYSFLSSITDISELINQHLNSVNLTPIDISEKISQVKDTITIDPSKLDITCKKKKIMTEAILKMLKKWQIFQTRLWLRTPMDFCRKSKTRLPSNNYRVSY